MSEVHFNPTAAGIELSTTAQVNPVSPTWLAEVLLLGEYWRRTGLLDRLQTEVKVNRGRMGHYEVCDFVLLLLAYAISGLNTLQSFFEQLNSVESVVMSVWQRQHCPVASTLSRFLQAIDTSALEQLRTLFDGDLKEHGFNPAESGHLVDRMGTVHWVFDIDGTHQAARQRSLPQGSAYPLIRRRTAAATAKGYRGRRRGEVTRTRTAVSQIHTSEWLGSFGAPGNGTPRDDLNRACERIQGYLQHYRRSAATAIVRLDGFYGTPQSVNQLQHHQLEYLLRSRDYGLLQHEGIQARLQQTPQQEWTHPESHQSRDVFDLGFVDDGSTRYCQPYRLIVVRTPPPPHGTHRVGKRLGEFIYELFITSLSPLSATGTDILSLYYGRGGYEKQFGDEDREGDCDRWCSWHPLGQEFWQILSQWVWNWRLWAGFAHHPHPLRETQWVAAGGATAVVPPPAVPLNLTPPRLPPSQPLSRSKTLCPPNDSPDYGDMVISSAWGKSLGKFSGQDFKLLSPKQLQCPAGNLMYRREMRQNQYGDLLMLFGINPRTCQACPLKQQCLAEGSKGVGGRRITVIRKRLHPLTEHPPERSKSGEVADLPASLALGDADLTVPETSGILESQRDIPLSQPPPSPQSQGDIRWFDLPATHLRRHLSHQLRLQQIQIHSVAPPLSPSRAEPLTRDQRAHRRLSWKQRWAQNASSENSLHWQVQLFGISSAILSWLDSLQPPSTLIT